MEKRLGKITSAKFGFAEDGYSFGIILYFNMATSSVGCGGKYTLNMHKNCKWERSIKTRNELIIERWDAIAKLLREAKVNTVDELIGKPVEITIKGSTFEDFRMLTEVL